MPFFRLWQMFFFCLVSALSVQDSILRSLCLKNEKCGQVEGKRWSSWSEKKTIYCRQTVTESYILNKKENKKKINETPDTAPLICNFLAQHLSELFWNPLVGVKIRFYACKTFYFFIKNSEEIGGRFLLTKYQKIIQKNFSCDEK